MRDPVVRVLASGATDATQRGLATAKALGLDPDRVLSVEEIPGSRSRRSRAALWAVEVQVPQITESELRLLDGNR